MLLITVEREAAMVTLRFDGRLAGPEARELAKTWSASAYTQPHETVCFDLAGLTDVDPVGREFLARAEQSGITLRAAVA